MSKFMSKQKKNQSLKLKKEAYNNFNRIDLEYVYLTLLRKGQKCAAVKKS